MATIPAASSRADVAPGDTRGRIAAAAFALFADGGYDGTTVEAIAERAGVARRTFFRYFRSKDDVIFPDHDALLESVNLTLEASDSLPAVEAISAGVRQVFRSYVNDPVVSVQRYRITRGIPALRERELASVQRYERTFSKYVRARLAGHVTDAEAALRADVLAAAVVAAHNAVLRDWLRDGGIRDFGPELESAFAWVARTFAGTGDPVGAIPAPAGEPQPGGPAGASGPAAGGRDDVVVAVFRADQPLTDVVERISRSL